MDVGVGASTTPSPPSLAAAILRGVAGGSIANAESVGAATAVASAGAFTLPLPLLRPLLPTALGMVACKHEMHCVMKISRIPNDEDRQQGSPMRRTEGR